MIRIYPMPLPVRTTAGRTLARYGIAPEKDGDPWWVVYRDDEGRWFTAIAEEAMAAEAMAADDRHAV